MKPTNIILTCILLLAIPGIHSLPTPDLHILINSEEIQSGNTYDQLEALDTNITTYVNNFNTSNTSSWSLYVDGSIVPVSLVPDYTNGNQSWSLDYSQWAIHNFLSGNGTHWFTWREDIAITTWNSTLDKASVCNPELTIDPSDTNAAWSNVYGLFSNGTNFFAIPLGTGNNANKGIIHTLNTSCYNNTSPLILPYRIAGLFTGDNGTTYWTIDKDNNVIRNINSTGDTLNAVAIPSEVTNSFGWTPSISLTKDESQLMVSDGAGEMNYIIRVSDNKTIYKLESVDTFIPDHGAGATFTATYTNASTDPKDEWYTTYTSGTGSFLYHYYGYKNYTQKTYDRTDDYDPHPLGLGSHTINITFDGDDDYAAASKEVTLYIREDTGGGSSPESPLLPPPPPVNSTLSNIISGGSSVAKDIINTIEDIVKEISPIESLDIFLLNPITFNTPNGMVSLISPFWIFIIGTSMFFLL